MPIRIPSDTASLFAANVQQFDSRSLLLDRFVYDHPAMDEARRLHFARVCEDSFQTIQATRTRWQAELQDERDAKKRRMLEDFIKDSAAMARCARPVGPAAVEKATSSRRTFITSLNAASVLHAQLQSRLMVNMSGGVMDNAGLCLDRFGLPYIPGTAVKGCARRAALAALHEWCETRQKPGATEADKDNLFKTACEKFASPAEMLAAIAQVFGWAEQDWKTRGQVLEGVRPKRDETDEQFTQRCCKLWQDNRSDFAWACSEQWEGIRAEALTVFGKGPVPGTADAAPVVRPAAGGRPEDTSANGRGARSPGIKDFAGSVSFLPSYPVDVGNAERCVTVLGLPIVEVPPLGKLELDVLTSHQPKYYRRERQVATDDDEPNPVVFPAVAAGTVFAFAIARLRNCSDNATGFARDWLACGLSTFGLGAKTAAGYGWFDTGEGVQQAIPKASAEAKRRREDDLAREREEARRKTDEEERGRITERRKAATANMTAEQIADYDLAQLTDDQFRGRLDQFLKREKPEQKAMLRAMRLSPAQTGSRLKFWDDLKMKAQKGGKPAQIEQAIRQLSRQMYPGKEGKMP